MNAADKKRMEDLERIQQLEALEEETSVMDPEPSFKEQAASGLAKGAKVADVTRVPLGAALGAGLEMLSGKDVINADEIAAGLEPVTHGLVPGRSMRKKTFPSTDEMLKRAGVPEGAKASDYVPGFEARGPGQPDTWWPDKGGALDPTLRGGTAGFAGDVLTDITTYLSLGMAGAAKQLAQRYAVKAGTTAEKILSAAKKGTSLPMDALAYGPTKAVQALPKGGQTALKYTVGLPSTAVEALSKKIYSSGIKPLVAVGAKRGKDIADDYYRAGIRGNAGTIYEQAGKAADRLYKDTKGIRKEAMDKGMVPNARIAREDYQRELAKAARDGRITEEQYNGFLNDLMDSHGRVAEPSIELVNKWKNDVGKGIPGKTWGSLTGTDIGNELQQTYYGSLKKNVEDAVGPRGKELARKNEQLGNFLTTLEKARDMSINDPSAMKMSVWDWLIASGEMPISQGAFGVKKGVDAVGSTAGKTRIGYWGRKAMENRGMRAATDGGVKRALTQSRQPTEEELLEEMLNEQKQKGK